MLHDQELTDAEQARITLIGNQILAEPHLWDDLYPPDPPPEAAQARPGRNDPCWCGSGRKYKHCHLRADAAGDG
ncbi:MAG: hypothetical protein HGA45_27075 [Chloroflexales bacterium]|nr:hypothetical protein [Chloroflexales bacterium]